MLFDDGSIMAIALAVEESGARTYIRSTDRGETWRPFKPPSVDYCMPNIRLPDGTAINSFTLPPPIPERLGYYKTTRFESKDRGLTGTITHGTLYLPPDVCSPKKKPHPTGRRATRSRSSVTW